MNKRTIVGLCLFSSFLFLMMPNISAIQSIEVEKEVKNLIQEKQEIFINIQGIINFLKSKFFKTIALIAWFISFIYCSFMLSMTILYVHFNVCPYPIPELIITILGWILVSIPFSAVLIIYILLLPFLKFFEFIKELVLNILSKIQEIIDNIKSIINPSYQANIA